MIIRLYAPGGWPRKYTSEFRTSFEISILRVFIAAVQIQLTPLYIAVAVLGFGFSISAGREGDMFRYMMWDAANTTAKPGQCLLCSKSAEPSPETDLIMVSTLNIKNANMFMFCSVEHRQIWKEKFAALAVWQQHKVIGSIMLANSLRPERRQEGWQ